MILKNWNIFSSSKDIPKMKKHFFQKMNTSGNRMETVGIFIIWKTASFLLDLCSSGQNSSIWAEWMQSTGLFVTSGQSQGYGKSDQQLVSGFCLSCTLQTLNKWLENARWSEIPSRHAAPTAGGCSSPDWKLQVENARARVASLWFLYRMKFHTRNQQSRGPWTTAFTKSLNERQSPGVP